MAPAFRPECSQPTYFLELSMVHSLDYLLFLLKVILQCQCLHGLYSTNFSSFISRFVLCFNGICTDHCLHPALGLSEFCEVEWRPPTTMETIKSNLHKAKVWLTGQGNATDQVVKEVCWRQVRRFSVLEV